MLCVCRFDAWLGTEACRFRASGCRPEGRLQDAGRGRAVAQAFRGAAGGEAAENAAVGVQPLLAFLRRARGWLAFCEIERDSGEAVVGNAARD
jgi:hypothetical protein